MKCYYEELAVERDANESEIKTAYRKLALKWHPDKNPECIEAAKERFQLIQQAYEVLSDPQERAWYDNHREQILRGKNSDYEDNCLDLFQYFTVSCFKGYGDDTKGFYAVYKEVFEKIAAEDAEFMDNEEDLLNIPQFGDSTSSYEETVGPFYAYWSAYCTKRTYTWLCPYDVKEIKDRRILREIEKDMKKVVQKAKKERNEEVRNLVSFVRKRDRRVKAYKQMLEERSVFNRQKQERNRLEQIRRRQMELEEMRRTSQVPNGYNDDYEEQLKQLEQEYSSGDEYYEDEEESVEGKSFEEYQDYNDGLYCVACNKEFKTEKSFSNHEVSKKHRDNIEKLKLEMQGEEAIYKQGMDEEEGNESEAENRINDSNESEDLQNPLKNISNNTDVEYNVEEVAEKLDFLAKIDKEEEDWNVPSKKTTKKNKNKSKVSQKMSNFNEEERNRSEQTRLRQMESEEMRQNSQEPNGYNDDHEEQLEQEHSSGDESYEDEDESIEFEDDDIDDWYCVACNKEFKTEKSFSNHQASKKHRDNMEELKLEMQGEETIYQLGKNLLEEEETLTKQCEENIINDSNTSEDLEKPLKNTSSKTRCKKDARNVKRADLGDNVEKVDEKFDFLTKIDKDDEDWNVPSKKAAKKNKNKSKISQKMPNLNEKESETKVDLESVLKNEAEVTQHICATCKSKFNSKNKLFSHLKITNHGVFIPKPKTAVDENSKIKKGKGRRNN